MLRKDHNLSTNGTGPQQLQLKTRSPTSQVLQRLEDLAPLLLIPGSISLLVPEAVCNDLASLFGSRLSKCVVALFRAKQLNCLDPIVQIFDRSNIQHIHPNE